MLGAGSPRLGRGWLWTLPPCPVLIVVELEVGGLALPLKNGGILLLDGRARRAALLTDAPTLMTPPAGEGRKLSTKL